MADLEFYILLAKSLATPDHFPPYGVNVESMEYCSVYLETAFISEEFCMNIFVVAEDAEE